MSNTHEEIADTAIELMGYKKGYEDGSKCISMQKYRIRARYKPYDVSFIIQRRSLFGWVTIAISSNVEDAKTQLTAIKEAEAL